MLSGVAAGFGARLVVGHHIGGRVENCCSCGVLVDRRGVGGCRRCLPGGWVLVGVGGGDRQSECVIDRDLQFARGRHRDPGDGGLFPRHRHRHQRRHDRVELRWDRDTQATQHHSPGIATVEHHVGGVPHGPFLHDRVLVDVVAVGAVDVEAGQQVERRLERMDQRVAQPAAGIATHAIGDHLDVAGGGLVARAVGVEAGDDARQHDLGAGVGEPGVGAKENRHLAIGNRAALV